MLNDIFYSLGIAQAKDLRRRAADLDGTAMIREEVKVPDFVPGKDYSHWPAGSPVRDQGQVWTLLQPYDGSVHPGHPMELRAIWGLCHTREPDRAKPWAAPCGTSGLYTQGECCREGETVWRCIADQTSYSPTQLPSHWEKIP